MPAVMRLFRFTVATARVSAALADGIATIDTENVVIVANGMAKGVALTTASGSVASTSAIIELGSRNPKGTARIRGCAPALGFLANCSRQGTLASSGRTPSSLRRCQ